MGWLDVHMERDLERAVLDAPRAPDWLRVAGSAVAAGLVFSALVAVGLPALDRDYAEQQSEILQTAPGWVGSPAEDAVYRELGRLERRPMVPHELIFLLFGALGGLAGAGLTLVPWLLSPRIRLCIAPHWVELDGQRVERADLRSLSVRDDRLHFELADGSVRVSDRLLRPVEVDYFLEGCLPLLAAPADEERAARDRATDALRQVRGAASARTRA